MAEKDRLDFSIFLSNYLNDAREGFQEINSALLELEKDHSRKELLDEIFRVVHTLKSSSVMLEFSDIAELAHISEDLLDRMRKDKAQVTQETINVLFEVVDMLEAMVKERAEGKSEPNEVWKSRFEELKNKIRSLADLKSEMETPEIPNPNSAAGRPTVGKIQTVRVHVELLDSIFNLAGELIITKNRIDNIISATANKELKAVLAAMDRMISALQEYASAARLVPIDEIFQKFPRMARDLAKEKNKEIYLVIEGREIELDKAILDGISEPLIHLIRNAVDHGIEPAEVRKNSSKAEQGTIKLSAKRSENHILIEVEDDGGGIDIAQMKEAAVRKGFAKPEEAELLGEKDILNLLYNPGFSSSTEVTELSGRGVGLDVVRTSIKKMGGTINLATQKGKGTRFTLKLPLTTAILQTLMVSVGEHVFAIPSDIVLETLEVRMDSIKEIRNQQVLVLRNQVIPFFELNELLKLARQKEKKEFAVLIIYMGDSFVGLGVDAVLDQTENIVKPFDPIAQQFTGFSGGTIMGDGRVALLMDIPSLLNIKTLEKADNLKSFMQDNVKSYMKKRE
jgi:two-component system chemotaxis sensor kinase CheA